MRDVDRLRAPVVAMLRRAHRPGCVVGPGARATASGPGWAGNRLLRDDRGAPMSDVRGDPREPGSQQHPGEPARSRGGHARTRPASRSPRRSRTRPNRSARRSPAGSSRSARASPARSRGRGGRSPWSARRLRRTSRRWPRSLIATPWAASAAGTSIAGATTIELSSEQAKLAAKSSSLWIQGGTPTDPVLAGVPAFADQFGFGALRCAIDNLNGDNVEWIQYPAGGRHVYCYAYYVTPPPTSGTIVIRKQVSDPPAGGPDVHVRGQRLLHAGRHVPA